MASTPADDGRRDESRPAVAVTWARRRWGGLDRGWQATLLGVVVVLAVLVL